MNHIAGEIQCGMRTLTASKALAGSSEDPSTYIGSFWNAASLFYCVPLLSTRHTR